MTTNGTCDLCGTHGPIRASLVAWSIGIGEPFANVDRCVDEKTCRERIETRGDEWPLREREAS